MLLGEECLHLITIRKRFRFQVFNQMLAVNPITSNHDFLIHQPRSTSCSKLDGISRPMDSYLPFVSRNCDNRATDLVRDLFMRDIAKLQECFNEISLKGLKRRWH